jgi:hypothetical protein
MSLLSFSRNYLQYTLRKNWTGHDAVISGSAVI